MCNSSQNSAVSHCPHCQRPSPGLHAHTFGFRHRLLSTLALQPSSILPSTSLQLQASQWPRVTGCQELDNCMPRAPPCLPGSVSLSLPLSPLGPSQPCLPVPGACPKEDHGELLPPPAASPLLSPSILTEAQQAGASFSALRWSSQLTDQHLGWEHVPGGCSGTVSCRDPGVFGEAGNPISPSQHLLLAAAKRARPLLGLVGGSCGQP